MKKYIYAIEKYATKDLTSDELMSIKDIGIINVLCYHVNTSLKYPFIQFLLDKTPHDASHVIREEFVMPSIIVTKNTQNVETFVMQKIKNKMESIGCNVSQMNLENNFIGIVDIYKSPFFLFNVSNIILNPTKMSRNSPSWFVLPSEIMNVGTVCDVKMNKHVRNLFLGVPELGLLHQNEKEHDVYPLPDVVYSGSDCKLTEFQCVTGVLKKQWVSSCIPRYGFCKLFQSAETIFQGILRCALFAENVSFHVEENDELSLTDEEIDVEHKDCSMIYIHYENSNEKTNGKPNVDILAFSDDLFEPLTCHEKV
jgi:hypothetical protein